jgi:hypothetical protein
MELSQAISYFAKDCLDGWDGTTWVENIAKGSLLTYDRFISARNFGLKKRIFLTGRDTGTLDAYSTVRMKNGTIYIVESKNTDTDSLPSNYANSYQLLKAEYQAEVIQLDTVTAASGTHRGVTRTTMETHHCDLERISSRSASADVPDIIYGQIYVVLPGIANVSTDNELRVNGILYDIKEVERQLKAIICYCYKRSGENI